jgi:hypothetical protein
MLAHLRRPKMHRRVIWGTIILLGLAAGVVCIFGCSKEATFLADDLGVAGRLRDTTLTATTSDWDSQGHSGGSAWRSKRLVVGAWRNYLARSFMKFSSLPDSTVEITDATLFLYAARVEGDVIGNRFTIHALADTLDQLGLFWDNMPEYSEEPALEFVPPVESRDSVAVDLTGIVTSWVSNETENLGIVIKLDEDQVVSDAIVELASRETPTEEEIADEDTTVIDYRPALRIAYLDTAGEQQYTRLVASTDVFADTLLAPFAADPLSILVANGSPTRGFVKFDVTAIPIEATVTKAVLELTPNLETSSFDSIEVICHVLPDSPWEGYGSDIGITGAGLEELVRRHLSEGETVRMVITPLIQPLIARTEVNYGYVLKSTSESADLDFIKFHSHLAENPANRPTLMIEYIVPPHPPYSEEQ